MSDVAAQMVSIFVSAIGLVLFRLISRFIPEEPPPRARDIPPDPHAGKASPESEETHG
ncbi:hypothetical protein AB0D37_07360 [Streptomyces sp. NPDC048384]|uniref:hypothetical protein n=1 Tax=Streptomyces sp. NPDC048384 TaxID=3155487 RepID=UPI0034213035